MDCLNNSCYLCFNSLSKMVSLTWFYIKIYMRNEKEYLCATFILIILYVFVLELFLPQIIRYAGASGSILVPFRSRSEASWEGVRRGQMKVRGWSFSETWRFSGPKYIDVKCKLVISESIDKVAYLHKPYQGTNSRCLSNSTFIFLGHVEQKHIIYRSIYKNNLWIS